MGGADLRRPARALGGPGPDGLPLASCRRQNVPFESALAKSWNMRLFKHLRREADKASRELAEERGPCPDAAERGVMERFSHKLAIAPTASISIICGGTSAPASSRSRPTSTPTRPSRGSFAVKNPYLERLLAEKGKNTAEVWSSILENEGSVAAPRLPQRRREGRLQDRLRDRPALGHRTRRRPHAGNLPVAVGERLPAGRRRQVGPAHAALDWRGSGA